MTHGSDRSFFKRTFLYNTFFVWNFIFLLLPTQSLWAEALCGNHPCVSDGDQKQYSPVAPNPKVTPGDLCTQFDPDFNKLDYPEQVPRCKRHTTVQLKMFIAAQYGNIPREEWRNYEFDHLIPLCVGGSNSSQNIWPQPKNQALEKDRLEDSLCQSLRRGSITQHQALEKLHRWFESISQRASQDREQNPIQNPNLPPPDEDPKDGDSSSLND